MDTQTDLMCKQHKKIITFICSCDVKYLCTSCFDSGRHSNHEVDIIGELDEDKQKETKMNSVQKENQISKLDKVEFKQFNEVKGDLLKFQAEIIVQQCNCITTNAKGLSQAMFQRFGVSAYDRRIKGKGNIADIRSIDIPGTCSFDRPKIKHKDSQIQYIANLFSQFAPGKNGYKYQNNLCQQVKDPQTGKAINDYPNNREKWFQQCLKQLADFAKEKKLYKIAFPHNIGCGLAGGRWENYRKYIKDFSDNNKELIVFIVQLEED